MAGKINREEKPEVPHRGRPADRTLDRRILQATLDILTQEGYFRFTLDSVARRAGIPKSTIYRRWATKGQLFADAVANAMPLHNTPIDTGTVIGDLTALLKRDLDAARKPGLPGIVMGLLIEAHSDPKLAPLIRQFMAARNHGYMLVLQGGIARREIDPRADLSSAISMLLGFLWHRLLTGSGELDDASCERLVRQLIEGIRSK